LSNGRLSNYTGFFNTHTPQPDTLDDALNTHSCWSDLVSGASVWFHITVPLQRIKVIDARVSLARFRHNQTHWGGAGRSPIRESPERRCVRLC